MTPPVPPSAPPRRKLITAGLIVGSLFTVSPVIGVLGTVVGMRNAFQALGSDVAGDTGQLSAAIGEVLISTFIGFILFVPGVVILTLSIIHHRPANRALAAPQAPVN